MSLRAQAARGLKWQIIEIGGRQLISLIVFTTLARLLAPEAFGLIGMVGVYLAFVGMIAEQGIGTAIIQRQKLEPGHLDAAFWFNMTCAALLCVATIGLAGMISTLVGGEPELPLLLRCCSICLVLNAAVTVQAALFSRELAFRPTAIRTFIANSIGGAIGVSIALAGGKVWALVGQQIGSAAAGAVFLWFASSWRPRFNFRWNHLKDLFGVSAGMLSIRILWFLSSRTDQVVIGTFLGTPLLGQYVVSNRASDLAKTVLYQPLGAVVLPAFSRLQHDRIRLRSAISRAVELNALVSFPCLVGLSAVAPDLVTVLFGPQWGPAGQVLQVIAFLVLANGLQGPAHCALVATGRPRELVWVGLAHAVGTAIACIVGVKFGLRGVAFGLLTNEIIMNVPRLYFLNRRVGLSMSQYCAPCVKPALSAAAMYACIVWIRVLLPLDIAPWKALVAQVGVGVSVYCTAMLLVARPTLEHFWAIAIQALSHRAKSPTSIEAPLS